MGTAVRKNVMRSACRAGDHEWREWRPGHWQCDQCRRLTMIEPPAPKVCAKHMWVWTYGTTYVCRECRKKTDLPGVAAGAGIALLAELRTRGYFVCWTGLTRAPDDIYVWPEEALPEDLGAHVEARKMAIIKALLQEEEYWRKRLHVERRSDVRRSEGYHAYLESERWRAFRRMVIGRANHQCERCHATGVLQVHHAHYDTLGDEDCEDVEVLCIPCHQKADAERRADNEERAGGIWERRLAGWAAKKYGEDWQERYDAEDLEEEFQDWLASRGER